MQAQRHIEAVQASNGWSRVGHLRANPPKKRVQALQKADASARTTAKEVDANNAGCWAFANTTDKEGTAAGRASARLTEKEANASHAAGRASASATEETLASLARVQASARMTTE